MRATPAFLDTWGVLVVMSLASFVLVLDTSMMNVAISAVVTDLHTTVQGVQAAIALYAMVMAAFTLAGGKFGDVFGMKRTFVVGMILYAIGTVTAAVTPNLAILTLGWSIIEGVGAALVLPMTLTLLTLQYTGARRAFGFGVIGGVQAAGGAVGPIFGGFMASQLSWRWAFGSEAVIVAIILALVYVLPSSKPRPESIDWPGIALSATGLSCIVIGLIMASYFGWWKAKRVLMLGGIAIAPLGLSIAPILISVGLGILVGLVHWLRHREAQHQPPLFRTALFKNRTLGAGVLGGGLLNLVLAGIMFTLPVFLQGALQMTPLASGLSLLPVSITVLVFSLGSSRLGQRMAPKQIMLFGLGLMAVGAIAMHNMIQIDLTIRQLIPSLMLLGSGIGLVLAQITNVTLSSVQPAESSEASGLNNTIRNLGTSMGTAVVGAILMTALYSGIVTGIHTEAGVVLTAPQRQQAIVALEDAVQTLSPAERKANWEALSATEQAKLETIVNTAWVRSEKGAILAVLVFILLCMAVISFI